VLDQRSGKENAAMNSGARHENVLRELSFKLQAMRRAEEVDTLLKKKRKTKDLGSPAIAKDV
jgi:hypothetical protein